MEFVSRWVGVSVVLTGLYFTLSLLLALVGPLELGDLLSLEGALWILLLGFGTGLVGAVLTSGSNRSTGPSHRIQALRSDQSEFRMLVAERIATHRDRIIASGHPDSEFLRVNLSNDKIDQISKVIGDKMGLTREHGASHSALLSNDTLAISFLTLREDVKGAGRWFKKEHGGYVTMMDKLISVAAEETEADGFCQITVGCAKRGEIEDVWVNLALTPLHTRVFKSHPVTPSEFMNI